MKRVLFALLLVCCFAGNVFAERADLTNFDFGVGIAQSSSSESAEFCVESHYFFDVNVFKKDIGVGPFVFMKSADMEIAEGLGVGLMIGLRSGTSNYSSKLKDNISSFNLGYGRLHKKNYLVFSTTF